jgi:hypothetical protein
MATVINQGQKSATGSVPTSFEVQIQFPLAFHPKKKQINKSKIRPFIGTLTFQQVIHG